MADYIHPQQDSLPVLMEWGNIQFRVVGLNFHEYDHSVQTDWARKDVLQTIPQREWVGMGDEEIQLRGKLFPEVWGSGWTQSQALDRAHRAGNAHMLMRNSGGGVGFPLGWFVIERINQSHQLVGANAIGRVVTFDALFVRVDTPLGQDYYPTIFSMVT